MKSIFLIPLLTLLLLCTSASAQIQSSQRKQQQKNDQKFVDEQIANAFFNNKEYDKSKEAFLKLYNQYHQQHHFNQFIESLIQLREFEEAEKYLQNHLKEKPNTWKSAVDLVYVYVLDGKTKKQKSAVDEILNTLPSDLNSIKIIANNFRNRGLNDYALMVFDKGAKINSEQYPFYIEKAYTYHSIADYPNAFAYYFKHLEYDPSQYDLIKTRLQSILMFDVNNNITDIMRVALLKKTQEQPDNIEFAKLLIWFSLQQEDYDIALAQSISLDRRIGDQEPEILRYADIALSNKQFDVAKKGYDYVYKKGKNNIFYQDGFFGLLKTEYALLKTKSNSNTKEYENLSKQIQNALSEVGQSQSATSLILTQAEIMAYHLGKTDEAISLLEQSIENALSTYHKAQLKLLLADIYLNKDEVWESTLLYSQVDKSMKEEPIGHEARFRNARLRYFIGEFGWADAQLQILKAATSKLVANDAMTLSLIISDNLEADTTEENLRRLSRADYYIFQHKEDQAITVLDSILFHDGNEISIPHALYRKAEIAEKREDYSLADSLYSRIFTDFPDSYMADDALLKDAMIAQDKLNDKEKAMQHYELLMDQYSTSVYVAQARKNYRKLQNK